MDKKGLRAVKDLSTMGGLLKEIRIRHGLTLRRFCLERELDAMRYSLIERNLLRPNESEMNEYLNLMGKEKK